VHFTLKISQDTTLEDFQAQIRANPGWEHYIVTPEEFAAIKAKTQARPAIERAIDDIIDPLKSQLTRLNARQQAEKRRELRFLAQYIVASKSSMQVIALGESPDFIVEQSGKRIGIELTQLVNRNVIAEANAFQKMLDATQQNILTKYPDLKKIYRFHIDLRSIVINNRASIIAELQSLVQAKIDGTTPTLPPYVFDVHSQNHDRLSLTLTEHYRPIPLASSDLMDLIKEKEARLLQYQANAQTDDVILLLIMEGSGTKSNYDPTAFALPCLQTGFSEILLFHEFDFQAHKLYP
jgi:hypothetical protein